MRRAAVLLATVFGIGRFPIAPATAASFVTAGLLAVLAHAAPSTLAPAPLLAAILALLPVAVWSSGEAEKTLGTDAKPIVIDEVIGMLVSVWGGLGIGAIGGSGRLEGERAWIYLAAAFLLFRLFDILKPFGIRRSQSLPGGYGVVVDDLLAGIVTNLVLRLLLWMGVPL
jgi:phosphatidylglycerophosphatase A